MNLIDTHCHIHSNDYPLNPDDVIADALKEGVSKMICVGQDLDDSRVAIDFVQNRNAVWASIGLHPHEAFHYVDDRDGLGEFSDLTAKPKVVAVGECGLDYFYDRSVKRDQRQILEFQLEIASNHNLPLIFHVREAFDDFWAIIDNFHGIRGVIHSFTADTATLGQALSRGLYVGLNGIMTFTKDQNQLEAAKAVPNDRLVLETDAPFLTPAPIRGTICQPKHVRLTAEFLASLRGTTIDDLANYSSVNADLLFGLS